MDKLELEIEWDCMRMLARWSPEARDLRFVMVVNRRIPILERIGDYITDICEQVVYLKEALVIKHQRLSIWR